MRSPAPVLLLLSLLLLLALSGCGKDAPKPEPGAPLKGVERLSQYQGVPQNGLELGDPEARVVVGEFVDPQCPFCADSQEQVFPELLKRYLRTGKVRLRLLPLAVLGEDSEPATRLILAAAQQDRAFQVNELLLASQQGEEDSGWVREPLLRKIAGEAGAPGALTRRSGRAVSQQMEEVREEAARLGLESTPAYYDLSAPSARPRPLMIGSGDPAPFFAKLDALLRAEK